MKLRVPLDLAFVVLVLSQSADGAFMAPRHATLLGKTSTHDQKEMPVTKHNKTAGDGYNPGSPLYAKQQDKAGGKEQAAVKTVKAEKVPGGAGPKEATVVAVTMPPTEQATDFDHWWKVRGGAQGHLIHSLWFFCQFLATALFFSLVWTKCTSPGRTRRGYDERKNTTMSFAYGLFSLDHCCAHHSSICLCSWCCYPLRLADTYAKEPFPLLSNFWSALILICCLIGLGQLTFGFTHLIFFGLAVYFRQQLRKQYGLESGGFTWLMDSLTWIFCPCCAMAQEARQVEFVKKPNDPVK